MDSISLPVVHPAFEKLKKSGNWLHIAAGLLILTHAISHMHRQETPTIYFWCQLLISVDIFILVLAGRETLRDMPNVNLFFRMVEVLFFLGIGLVMAFAGSWAAAAVHLSLSMAYIYLFYCEKKLRKEELLSIHHTGITIPGLPESQFLFWTHINHLQAHYDSIHISTSEAKNLRFDLRKNLDFAELEIINDFCRHYLGKC